MTEPYNFYRQAKPQLERLLPLMQGRFPREFQSLTKILALADDAVKFVLPTGGRIMDDRLRGLPTDIMRLPYSVILLEYAIPSTGYEKGLVSELFKDNQTDALNRIVVAWQEGENEIGVASIVEETRASRWTCQPWIAFLTPGKTRDWEWTKDLDPKHNTPMDLSVSFMKTGEMADQVPDWKKHAFADMHDEVGAVLELIEALTCKNVATEALPVRKLNKNAKRNGALPFDEYRVLTVTVPSMDGKDKLTLAEGRTGTGRSPREHLRRGHIRRLEKGNIWVQATVVNAGSKTHVNKTYKVKG